MQEQGQARSRNKAAGYAVISWWHPIRTHQLNLCRLGDEGR
jgi:hypothetical protein